MLSPFRSLVTVLDRARKYYFYFGWRGLVSAIRNWFRSGSVDYAAKVEGVRRPLFLRSKSSDFFAFQQVFGRKEYELELQREPRVIVDAGANVGLAALYFANKHPDARILAIEPEECNYRLLEKNAEPYPGITPIRAALWYEDTELDLVDPGTGEWGYQTHARGSGETNKRIARVRALCIESLMKEHGIDFIDVLKVDIEGAEKELFEHAKAWIRKVGVIIVELHERKKPGCRRSFYNATNQFDIEWLQGENVFLAMDGWVARAP